MQIAFVWDEVWAKAQLVLLEQVFVCSCVDGFLGHLLSKLSKHICCCLGFVLRACMLALYVAIAYSCLRFHSSRLYSSLHLCGCEDVPSSWATSAFTCARLRVCFSSLPWFYLLSGLPILVLGFVFLWSSTSTFVCSYVFVASWSYATFCIWSSIMGFIFGLVACVQMCALCRVANSRLSVGVDLTAILDSMWLIHSRREILASRSVSLCSQQSETSG